MIAIDFNNDGKYLVFECAIDAIAIHPELAAAYDHVGDSAINLEVGLMQELKEQGIKFELLDINKTKPIIKS